MKIVIKLFNIEQKKCLIIRVRKINDKQLEQLVNLGYKVIISN